MLKQIFRAKIEEISSECLYNQKTNPGNIQAVNSIGELSLSNVKSR